MTAPSGRPDVRPAPFGARRRRRGGRPAPRLRGAAGPRAVVARTRRARRRRSSSRRTVREALVGRRRARGVDRDDRGRVDDAALLGDDAERVRVDESRRGRRAGAALEPAARAARRAAAQRRAPPGRRRALRGGHGLHPSDRGHRRRASSAGAMRGGELVKLPSEDERARRAARATRRRRARPRSRRGAPLASALRLDDVRLGAPTRRPGARRGVHPTRCATLVDARTRRRVLGVARRGRPDVVAARAVPGLAAGRRLGWLDCSLDRARRPGAVAARRSERLVDAEPVPVERRRPRARRRRGGRRRRGASGVLRAAAGRAVRVGRVLRRLPRTRACRRGRGASRCASGSCADGPDAQRGGAGGDARRHDRRGAARRCRRRFAEPRRAASSRGSSPTMMSGKPSRIPSVSGSERIDDAEDDRDGGVEVGHDDRPRRADLVDQLEEDEEAPRPCRRRASTAIAPTTDQVTCAGRCVTPKGA